MMGYIHSKIIGSANNRKMKPGINSNIPNIQIRGIAEHLVVLKTWMKIIETKGDIGVTQAFNTM